MKLLIFILSMVAATVMADDKWQPASIANWPSVQRVSGSVDPSHLTLSTFSTVSLSSTPVQVKISACEIWGWYFYNNNATSERSVKLFNSSAAPKVGTTKPDLTITVGNRQSAPISMAQPFNFSNGLWLAATTASGSDNATTPANGEVSANVLFR